MSARTWALAALMLAGDIAWLRVVWLLWCAS